MTRRTIALVLGAMWLGAALLTVTVVAPGAFAVLPTRALAGEMVGRVLPVVFAGAVVVPALVLALVPTLRRGGAAMLASIVSALSAAVALFIVNPRIAVLRVAIGMPVDQLPPTDPRRVLFGVLHAGSVALLGVAMVAMVVLIVVLARSTAGRAPSTPES